MDDKIKKYGRCIVIFTATAIVTAIILFLILYKPPLKNACIEDLKDIDGIGEKTIEKVKEKYR